MRASARKVSGRGLGLASVLGAVRGHGGALKLDSKPNHGTTFQLLLPCASAHASDTSARDTPKATWLGQGMVLMVDAEESVRQTAAMILRRLGFEVSVAMDGPEALELFRQAPNRFVLVLIDLTMPHLDGVQMLAALRQIRGDVRVVLMSGYNESEATSRFSDTELSGFLPKPFELEEVGETLKRVLGVSTRTTAYQ